MVKLRTKLAFFNLLSKLVFTALFIAILPFIVERINIIQTDNELIQKREEVIELISEVGIEPFITQNTGNSFGSYNILKEEFINLEKIQLKDDWNFIEVSKRLIEDETIDYRVLNYSFKIDDQTYLLEIGKSLESIHHTQNNIKKVILVFLFSIIMITLFADFYYTRMILSPLDAIIRKLKKSSTPSHFDKTPVITSTSEFRQLDQILRKSMDEIDNLFQKEKEITVNISHELMTPISILRSKLENLLLQQNIENDVAEKIEESLRTLHRLQTLVKSLLLIAGIESEQYLKEDSFSIKDLLKEISDEIEPVAADAGIRIINKYEEDMMVTNANRSLVFSMIYNVVNNSVKNTSSGGEIILRCGNYEGKFEITISDTGKGMTQDEIDVLFLRFKKKLDPQKESTGIGMAITKSIADFHKIDISVTSNPGKGTKISFFLPENS